MSSHVATRSSEEISREELYIQREREQDMLYRQVRDADIFYSQGSLPESPSKVRPKPSYLASTARA